MGTLNRGSSDEAGNTGIPIASKHWVIVQGWIPLIGDETVSLLNVSGQEAHVEITVYYSHRDPAGPYRITVPEGRTEHVHLNCLSDPELIPRATNYVKAALNAIKAGQPVAKPATQAYGCAIKYGSRDGT